VLKPFDWAGLLEALLPSHGGVNGFWLALMLFA